MLKIKIFVDLLIKLNTYDYNTLKVDLSNWTRETLSDLIRTKLKLDYAIYFNNYKINPIS